MESYINPDQNRKKRVLKKVREQFIHKKPDENSAKDIDPTTRCLSTGVAYPIIPSIGLVEIDRKICVELEFVQSHYHLTNVIAENDMGSSMVTMYFQRNTDTPMIPWEYAVKRLESYGDLELAMWAHRIRSCYTNHQLSMEKYFSQMYSGERRTDFTMDKARIKAEIACQNIESQYPYFKGVYFSTRDTTDLLTVTMNDSFLKEMGHTVESYFIQLKNKGIMPIVPKESITTKGFGKSFLNYFMGTYKPTEDENDFMYDKNGGRRKCVMQNMMILDPTPDGIYIYIYFILKKERSKVDTNNYAIDEEKVLFKRKKFEEGSMSEEHPSEIGQTKISMKN